MNESELRGVLLDCVRNKRFCRLGVRGESERFYCLPLKCSGELYLTAEERDFGAGGFTIRRLCDLREAVPAADGFLGGSRRAGLIPDLVAPAVDITDPGTAFDSLFRQSRCVIIEAVGGERGELVLLKGRIVGMYLTGIELLGFNMQLEWEPAPVRVAFSSVSKISFGADYLDSYCSLLPPCPYPKKKQP